MGGAEEAGRKMWVAAGVIALLFGAGWASTHATKEQVAIGFAALLATVAAPFMLWAIIAPILRWWRKRNAMTLDKALSILRKR